MNIIFEIFQLTFPLLFALIIIVIAIFSKFSELTKEFTINLPYIGIPIKLKKKTYLRILLILIFFSFITYQFTRDYSGFFKSRLNFEVFYDKEGIEKSILDIKRITKKIKFATNWFELRNNYFNKLDSMLIFYKTEHKKFFSYNNVDKYLVSFGEAHHELKYIGFWQRYKITQISGITTHKLHFPNSEPIKFTTKYELLDKPENLVQPTLKEFFSFEMVVKPTIAQKLIIHIDKSIYETELIGITHLVFFPYNSLEKTVFAFNSEYGLVPIGYAYYKEEE